LGLVLVNDLVELVPRDFVVERLRRLNWHRMGIWAFGLVFVGYMVVVPTAGWVMERMYPPKIVTIHEDMPLGEQMRLRSMEAMTAMFFFSVGAAIGSFLNVVAYRLPQGESVVFRASSCPRCDTKIEGRDNVPILGWLWLRGRCRACQSPISPRYPIVESVCAALFLLLYFVELISGGANIPIRKPNFYHGVVWIIFYTKWDVVGLYLYHCFVICSLLSCVLIDIDRERVPLRAKWIVGAALLIPALIWPDLLPVPWLVNAPDWLDSPHIMVSINCLLGGLAGFVLGWLTQRIVDSSNKSAEPVEGRGRMAGCLAVVGMALGWQASVAVLLCTLVILLIAASIAFWQKISLPRLPAVLMTAFVLHHVFWRWTTEHWSTWWPCHRTSASGWIAIAGGLVVLLLANRLLIRKVHDQLANQFDKLDADAYSRPMDITPTLGFASEQKDTHFE
ncbi:MAG: prepilin peptidase, partial [Planctomycetota bacterium]